MRYLEARPKSLRGVLFVGAWLWWCFVATSVSMADPADEDPPSTNQPVSAAKAGLHIFHDRVTTFVDAQLDVLEENGMYNGEEIAVVFLGINNRWEDAWQLTWSNFQRDERVIVVPTYNLPAKWMDYPGTAADKGRVESPASLLKTRKIGVPELLDHLGQRDIRVSGLAFSSGANFVLQENASHLVKYAESTSSESGRPNVPSLILYHSGQISETVHTVPLLEAGYRVRPSGERALVTALQERFADMDPTGLRVPLLEIGFYVANVASHAGEPLGPEGRHGYAKFRDEVNEQLVDASIRNAAQYNVLIHGLTAPKTLETPDVISMALGEMKEKYAQRVGIALAVEQVKTQLEQEAKSDRPDAKPLGGWEPPRLVRQILDTTRAEGIRLSTPPGQRRLIGFRLPCDEKMFCRVLGVTPDDLRVVHESEIWIEKQVGYTRWSTVARKGSDEAFLLYDATGQRDDKGSYKPALKAFKETLNKIERHMGPRGIVLVGDPTDREYKRLKKSIEADKDLEVAAEVDTRGKSRDQINEETEKAVKDSDASAAMKAGPQSGGVPGGGGGGGGDDATQLERPDDPDLDVEVEKINGGWKITYKINGIPVWEVILDDEGNIIWEGPPGGYPGGYDGSGNPNNLKLAKRDGDRDWRKPDPVLFLPPRVPELDRLAALGFGPMASSYRFDFPPLCPPPIPVRSSPHRMQGGFSGEVMERWMDLRSELSRPSSEHFSAVDVQGDSPKSLSFDLDYSDGFRRRKSVFRFVSTTAEKSFDEEVPADEGRVEVSAPEGSTVTISGRAKGQQRQFRFPSFPAGKAFDYAYRVRLPNGQTVERTISLTAGKFVRLAALSPDDLFDSWRLVECLPADAPLSDEVVRLIDATQYDEAVRLAPGSAKARFELAASHFTLGRFDKVINDLAAVIEIDPKFAGGYVGRGAVWFEKKEYDKAIADYDKAIELDPKCAIAYNTRGLAWNNKGEYDKAIADYDKAIELDPKYAVAYNNRGLAWNNKGEYDKAIADCDKAIELDPKCAIMYRNRGDAWRYQGEIDKAIADYDKAIELDPKCAATYNNRGLAWNGKGEFEKAIADYNKAIELDPKWAIMYDNRGDAWLYQGEIDKGIADYDKAIELDPMHAGAYCGRGNALRLNLKFDEAIADCTKAIEIDPKYAAAYVSRAMAREQKGEYDKAISDCDKAIELNPKYADAFASRGALRMDKGEFNKAIADCTRAIELDPNLPICFWCRGRVWLFRGEYDKAIADFTRTVELSPQWACNYYQLANAWIRKERFDNAIEVTEKLLSIAPDAVRSHLVHGDILFSVGRPDEAMAAFDKALQLDPNSVHAFTGRASVWTRKGDFDKAIRELERVVGLRPRYVTAHTNLAIAYNNRANARANIGQFDQAVADYDKVIEICPTAARAYYNRARAKFARNDLDAALADYNEALRLSPESADARAGRGAVHLAKEEWDTAIAEYQQAIQSDQTCTAALLGLAAAKRAQGNVDEAISAYDNAIRQAPNRTAAYYIRGDTWLLKGRSDKALSDYKSALRTALSR